MLQKLLSKGKILGKERDSLSVTEEAAVARVVAMHRRLVIESNRVNTKTEAGFNACAAFLDVLASTARTLQLEAAPRTYRSAFTINYRALFPDEARHYRVDVLEASSEQYAAIWVNGDKFEFSAEAMHLAQALQLSWSELSAIFERWASSRPRSTARPGRAELRSILASLDIAWANFEQKYIAELIAIEEKARRLIVQAIEHECSLKALETKHGKGEALDMLPEYQEVQTLLVRSIAHLNSVANFRRKGRDDLGAEVLFDALATLRRCNIATRDGMGTKTLSAAHVLSTDVVESFEAMRDYLREVGSCMERVDPHLCNNVGLAERLVDVEESWEVGARYVQHEDLLCAVCDLVEEIQLAQRLVPALSKMCEDCDAELFMVLPGIIWVRILSNPGEHTGLLKSLLPHRLVAPKADSSIHGACVWDDELEQFAQKFRDTKQLLVRSQSAQPSSGSGRYALDSMERHGHELLMKRVVAGSAECQDCFAKLVPTSRETARASIEDLMHELERWSIELQRHCPEDWNQCSAILVQCLSGSHAAARTKAAFRV